MRLKSVQKLEDLGAVDYIELKVWTLALEDIIMETLEYLLDSGNVLNMFDIQECWNRISQRDGYLYFKINCLTLVLLCTSVLGTNFFFGLLLFQISLLVRFFKF